MRGRIFSYGDAQGYRLGVNHGQIPVNAPRFPFHSYHRDGAMQVNTNHGSTIVYKSNNCGWLQEQPDFSEPPLSIRGRWRSLESSGRLRRLFASAGSIPPDDTSAAAGTI